MRKRKKISKGIKLNRKNQLWYCIQHGGKSQKENFAYHATCRNCQRALARNPSVRDEMVERERMRKLPEKKIEQPVRKLTEKEMRRLRQ